MRKKSNTLMSKDSDQSNVKKSHREYNGVLLNENSPLAVKEAYNMLRTNVMFSLPGNSCKYIGLTSSTSGEGKSLTAMNLAIAFGQIGKKVLLIDADMRKNSVGRAFGLPNSLGLSDVLIGEKKVEDVLKRSKQWHFDAIMAGTKPPDISRLLESKQMTSLIETVGQYYEYVFFDLPPISIVADAGMMAKYLDGFILVVRHGVSKFRGVEETISLIHGLDTKILGYVYNDMDMRKKYYGRYGKYGYGKYGYGYGYDYGNDYYS